MRRTVEEVDVPTQAGHESDLAFLPAMDQKVIFIILFLLIIHISCGRLGQAVAANRTCGDLELSRAAPGRLLKGHSHVSNATDGACERLHLRKPVH